MNKKPVMFRLVCAVIIIAIFAYSMYPLKPLNFYNTLEKLSSPQVDKTLEGPAREAKIKEMDKKLQDTIALAKEKEAKGKINNEGKKVNVYPPEALENAAKELGTDLTKYVVVKQATKNRDVISFIKMKSASSIRLGIDLNGGVEFLLEVIPIPAKDLKDNDGKTIDIPFYRQRDTAIEVLRDRLESENIFEAEISPVGAKLVSLKVPTTSKNEIENIKQLLMMSARLEFREVHPQNTTLVQAYLRVGKNMEAFKKTPEYKRNEVVDGNEISRYKIMEKDKTSPDDKLANLIFFVKKKISMRGKGTIAAAYVSSGTYGQREIILNFTSSGTTQFADITSKLVGRQLAIILDNKLYSAPNISEAIKMGRARITGDFSTEEAKRISNALMSGNLPKMKVEAMFETDPTLGKEAVESGTMAGIYGLIAVVMFMLIYYMRAGFVANVALCANVVLIMGFMATFRATLTLPGIAGIILTIGMAVDANVLIFERIREELNKKKNLFTAIDLGYSRAFITIFDANITTLFVALILMWKGSGPIKGFAVTLAIGIVTSMFTSLFLTRLLMDIFGRLFKFKDMKMLQFFKSPSFNFLGMKKVTLALSFTLIFISLLMGATGGKECLGIDFMGGTRITYDYKTVKERPQEADIIKKLGKKFDSKVSYKKSLLGNEEKEKLEIVLREKNPSENQNNISLKAKVKTILEKAYPDFKLTSASETSVGGLIGEQFAISAIIAIVLAIIGIILYISLRFEFAFATASIIAIIHDIIIATGVFIILGYFFKIGSGELSLPVIAALLTIIGYSLNDTIVVFDRIREDLTLIKDKSYKEIINISINQTLSRTVLTSVTTLIVLIALYVAGVAAINDFVLVMIIGVVVGTYSSIFIASPIVSVWHKRIGASVKE